MQINKSIKLPKPLAMALKALDVLKKGLNTLEKQFKTRKEKLLATLAEKKRISPQDEEWLNDEANLVNEWRVIDALESASDYERGFQRLDDAQKGLVHKLREIAGDVAKVVGKKQKRASLSFVYR